MLDNLLIDKITKKNIDAFLVSNFPCLALIGPVGSGKVYLAHWILDQAIDPESNISSTGIMTLDGKVHGIDDIRLLQSELKMTKAGSGKVRRGIVLDNFDNFGHESQNALLKTLEEPPLDCLIILCVTNKNRVLETIFSRVRQVDIRPIARAHADKYFSDKNIDSYYNLSSGNAGTLVNLVNNNHDNQLIQAVDHAKKLLKMPKSERLSQIDSIVKTPDTEYPKILLLALQKIFRAVYLNQLVTAEPKSINSSITRLHEVEMAIKHLDMGLNKKLIFTKLFSSV